MEEFHDKLDSYSTSIRRITILDLIKNKVFNYIIKKEPKRHGSISFRKNRRYVIQYKIVDIRNNIAVYHFSSISIDIKNDIVNSRHFSNDTCSIINNKACLMLDKLENQITISINKNWKSYIFSELVANNILYIYCGPLNLSHSLLKCLSASNSPLLKFSRSLNRKLVCLMKRIKYRFCKECFIIIYYTIII
uniref:Uncharacterized protein n=1 Tax=Amorphochlora amoebiformis TaxID=1561963 RepID=A0A0H5BII0_9EUKA|nr:hypothetical protein [Amorphochlora amoebiformis]